jgi:hypothetical protein
MESETFGTVFEVDGTWYLRFQGGGGVLVPLETQGEFRGQLENGKTFRLEGHMGKNHLGCPERYYACGGKRIGS